MSTESNFKSVLRMRKRLEASELKVVRLGWADLVPFSAAVHKAGVHNLLQDAYSNGFGSVPALDVWWQQISEDAEFDMTLLTVAVSVQGQLLGFIHSWNSAFIKDLVVADTARRRGVGSALLLQSFNAFRERGLGTVDLKVMAANRAAIGLYRSAGMVTVIGEN